MASSLGSNRRSEPTATPVDIARRPTSTTRAPEWPGDLLDVEALRATGWRPVPFRQFVLKLSERCNLACPHCFVFEMADQSWRSKPARMRETTVAATAARIAEHARRHELARVTVFFHGGEPLLAGAGAIVTAATVLREALPAGVQVEIGVQTNGVLLKEPLLHAFLEAGIRVGVSVDGSASQHDRHRRFRDGTGSHSAVSAGLALLARRPYREIFSGLLCTVDATNAPVETYEALLEFAPPAIDFLLPHGNWSTRPPLRTDELAHTPYADWLIAVFDRWYSAPHRETGIRLFEEILSLILGGPSRIEAVGLSPVGLIVVDTDGAIEQVDALKSAYDGAAGLGLNVAADSFDTALDHPAIAARQIGAAALCDTCRACSIRDVCGGGHFAHRYRAGEGYRNPSVFCPDLLRLIGHIRGRVEQDTVTLLRT